MNGGFNPDDAHLKMGPAYLQVVSVEAGVLFSDYDGVNNFRPGEEPGLLGFVGLNLKGALRLGPSLFVTVDGRFMYLLGENKLVLLPSVGGGMQPMLNLEYELEISPWTIRAYDRMGVASLFNLQGIDGIGGIDRAGRYQFGFAGFDRGGRGSSDVFNPIIYNRLGVEAERPVLDDEWNLVLRAEQADYWRPESVGGDDHNALQRYGVELRHVGKTIPFSPYFRYDAYSQDYFADTFHLARVGGQGRITERLRANGYVGYRQSTGYPVERGGIDWRFGLQHDISERTKQGIQVGQGLNISDFTSDTNLSDYLLYYIDHELSEDLTLRGFAQWSEDDFLSGPLSGQSFQREIYGAQLRYNPTSRSYANLGYLYENRRRSPSGVDDERKAVNLNINQRITSRTISYFRFRFEDTAQYDEFLYIAGIRRYF